MSALRPEPRSAGIVAAVLAVCYLGTLASGVTLWDAGEFASAVATFGVPHPPGTPLYVTGARAFALLFGWMPTARATSLFSACCTIASCAIIGWLVARWTRRTLDGVAAGCLAGLVSSVWLNANETEVYAASLLLSVLLLLVAERARDADDERASVLLAYGFALAVPLHLSALVAAPAAIVLAALDREGGVRVARALALTGAFLASAGAGVVSPWPIAAGAIALLASVGVRDRRGRGARAVTAIASAGAIVLALSPVAIMLVRASHDPGINQGNPATLDALLEVVARRQYAVPGLWPRRAPFWLQLSNVFEYADWQVGLGFARDSIGPAWRRTPLGLALVVMAWMGARAHARTDRRSWWAVLALLAAGTIGVAVYLNLQAGPSIGYGILPDDAGHEARERDYFFALGFAAWGAWAGIGLAVLARRISGRRAGVVVATGIALVATSNWLAVDRSRGANAHLADRFARALLETAPRDAVLFVAGDNDTYPLWYAQWGGGLRTDVTPVTIPLLPADWYRAELARRHALGDPRESATWSGETATIRTIARRAEALGRPVAATVSVDPSVRAAIGGNWILDGVIYRHVARSAAAARTSAPPPGIDSVAARGAVALVDGFLPLTSSDADFPDPTARYVASLLGCPRLALDAARKADSASRALLDSRCNFR